MRVSRRGGTLCSGTSRRLPSVCAIGSLPIVGFRRRQKLDRAFVADGRYPLEVRRPIEGWWVARVLDGLPKGGKEASVLACGRDQRQDSHHAWPRVVQGMHDAGAQA